MRADQSRVAALEGEIARLRDLELDGLRARWRTAVGRAAPAHLSRGLLLRLLAYRLQAEVFGDLDPATARALDRMGAEGRKSLQPSPPRLRPGTLLVREWNGTPQRVMVLEDGFAWNGTTFSSLSQVARAITGTRWNGRRFFGLDKDRPEPRRGGGS